MSLRDSYTYEEPTAGGFKVLPEGEYDFIVKEVFDWQESKKGNDMLPIDIEVEGTSQSDWLVFVDSAKWKIDSFLKSIYAGALPPGKKIDFENTEWMLGRKGRVKLKIKTIPKKNSPGETMEVNEIDSYLYDSTKIEGRAVTTPRAAAAPASAPAQVFEEEDDVPF